jgi:hypothetical protein
MVTFIVVMGEDDAFVELIQKITMKGAKDWTLLKDILYCSTIQKGLEQSTWNS